MDGYIKSFSKFLESRKSIDLSESIDFLNLKIPKTEEEVKSLCEIFDITKYKINNDLSIDVYQNVELTDYKFKIIPLKFNIVKGDFDCSNNGLISLENAPNKVYGDFLCYGNNLKSLEKGPIFIEGDFICLYSKLLSLKGAPNEIKGKFLCSFNELKSLQYCPINIGKDFDCSNNKLENLLGLSIKKINGDFNCSNNKITSLKGCPEYVKNFDCSDNELISLEFAPKIVDGNFACSKNKVKFTEEDVRAVSKVKDKILV